MHCRVKLMRMSVVGLAAFSCIAFTLWLAKPAFAQTGLDVPGHDSPALMFISGAAGSGNTMTYYLQLPADPTAAPTVSGTVADYSELAQSLWFGVPVCDPKSYPEHPCAPDSDANSGSNTDPNAAGSAAMALQFLPPGFPPLIDGISCSSTQWCAALTVSSLECTFGFATCNNNCILPANFALLQTDGVPSGPPSAQLQDTDTFFGNANTLKLNPGDVLKVSITDPPGGLTTTVHDLTTGQSGQIQASAANGFMNTNIADCTGTPFTFHAEYSTAAQQNQVPWTSLEFGVVAAHDLGNFEPCASTSSSSPLSVSYPDGQSFQDPSVNQVCNGGLEGAGAAGEGPCNAATGVCVGSTTQNDAACPTNNFTSGAVCEFSDGNCVPAGARMATRNGVTVSENAPLAGCFADEFQNGDLDFDGSSYQQDWPDGSGSFPSAMRLLGPVASDGSLYGQIRFETNVAGSENDCNTATGAGCQAFPQGARFYPFWSISASQTIGGIAAPPTGCIWNFGNDIAGVTTNDFGKQAQYGTPDVTRNAGTIISQALANPTANAACVPDLKVIVSGNPNPVGSGERLTYTITVTNSGGANATGVALSDQLPASVHFDSVSTPTGWACIRTTSGSHPRTKGGTVKCNPTGGVLAGGTSATIPIIVTATTPGTLSDTATLSATNVAPDGDDNGTVTTTVVGN
jgi:uncharacterized repeat protein (TIGR01451 family)